MKFSNLTLNQAKMHLSNFVLDEFGFSADNLLNIIEAVRSPDELQTVVNKLIPHLKSNQAKDLMNLWMEINTAMKRD